MAWAGARGLSERTASESDGGGKLRRARATLQTHFPCANAALHAASNDAASKCVRLVRISEGMSADRAFARQARRKFVA